MHVVPIPDMVVVQEELEAPVVSNVPLNVVGQLTIGQPDVVDFEVQKMIETQENEKQVETALKVGGIALSHSPGHAFLVNTTNGNQGEVWGDAADKLLAYFRTASVASVEATCEDLAGAMGGDCSQSIRDNMNSLRDDRVEALPLLQKQAGAAYTLYGVATKALQGAAGDANAVDWVQVHRDVLDKAVRQDQQPIDQVLAAIKAHSPGAVTAEQIAAVEAVGDARKMIKVQTDFRVLMAHAVEVGRAKTSGDPQRLANAEKAHDAYRELCLMADSMSLGRTYGALDVAAR